jgi:hypothetical protein
MSLLTNVMDHSLDDGYAEAAARKKAAGTSGMPKTLRAKLGLAAGLVLAALVVTVGAAQARVAAPVVAKERQELIDRIDKETTSADKLEGTVDKLRDDVSARQRAALKTSGGSDQADLVGILSGATAVHGPGVRLVVDDAKEASTGGADNPRETAGLLRHRAGARPRHAARRQRTVGGGRRGHLHQRAAADGAVRDQGRG